MSFWQNMANSYAAFFGTLAGEADRGRVIGISPEVSAMIGTASFAKKTQLLDVVVGPNDLAIMPVFYFVFDKVWKQKEIKLPIYEGLSFWRSFESALNEFSHGGTAYEPNDGKTSWYKIHTLTEPISTSLRFLVVTKKPEGLPRLVDLSFGKGQPGVYVQNVPSGVLGFRCLTKPRMNTYRILGQGKGYGTAWAIDVTIVPSYATGTTGHYYEPFFLVHIGAPYNDTPDFTQFDSWLLSIVNWLADIVIGIIGGILKGVSGGYIDLDELAPRMREKDFKKRPFGALPSPKS